MIKKIIIIFLLLIPSFSFGYASPLNIDIATGEDFLIFTKNGVQNTGISDVAGNIGVRPETSAFMYLPCSQFSNGGRAYGIDTAGPVGCSTTSATLSSDTSKLNLASSEIDSAFSDIRSRSADQTAGASEIGGRNFQAGVYRFNGAVTMASDLIISGSSSDIFIFDVTGAYAQSSGVMTLQGGAQANNVFWRIDGAVTIEADSGFTGNLFSLVASTLSDNVVLNGRLLSQTSVSLNSSNVDLVYIPYDPESPVTLPESVYIHNIEGILHSDFNFFLLFSIIVIPLMFIYWFFSI
jgi:hypothetical protein